MVMNTRLPVFPGGFEDTAFLDPSKLRAGSGKTGSSGSNNRKCPPRSGFYYFMLATRDQIHPGRSLDEMRHLAGPLWDDLDPTEKQAYMDRAKGERQSRREVKSVRIEVKPFGDNSSADSSSQEVIFPAIPEPVIVAPSRAEPWKPINLNLVDEIDREGQMSGTSSLGSESTASEVSTLPDIVSSSTAATTDSEASSSKSVKRRPRISVSHVTERPPLRRPHSVPRSGSSSEASSSTDTNPRSSGKGDKVDQSANDGSSESSEETRPKLRREKTCPDLSTATDSANDTDSAKISAVAQMEANLREMARVRELSPAGNESLASVEPEAARGRENEAVSKDNMTDDEKTREIQISDADRLAKARHARSKRIKAFVQSRRQ